MIKKDIKLKSMPEAKPESKKAVWKKLKKWGGGHLWFLIGIISIISIILGYIGFRKYFLALGEVRSFWDLLYLDLQLFTLESGSVSGPVGWELQIARLLSPAIATFAAIKALALIFREQWQLFRIRFLRNHVIICGLGRKGLLLAQGFMNEGQRVVVIERDEGNDKIPQCREAGILVLVGDATDITLLNKARIQKAGYLISVCGDDGTNTELAMTCKKILKEQRNPVLTCIVHIVNPRLCLLLRERELETEPDNAFRLEFFNIFDQGGRACLSDYPPFDHHGHANSRIPHLLIVGLGRLGENLVIQAAKNWKALSPEKKLDITILDREAEEKMTRLHMGYPPVKEICNLHALQMEIHSPDFLSADFLSPSKENHRFTSVYICLDNDSFALSTALNLNRTFKNHEVSIVVRMARKAGLAALLGNNRIQVNGFDHLHVFGLLDRTCTPAVIRSGIHETLARTIHEEYVRKQLGQGQSRETNPSLVPWPELPETLKESNRSQADHIRIKLKHLGCGIAPLTTWDPPEFAFTAEEIEQMARLEHRRWMEERRSNGWKYLPGSKNIEKKTSPYLVPWEELSEEIRELDRNTVRDIPFLLGRAGFQIYRQKQQKNKEISTHAR